VFFAQFADFLVIILLIAAGVSLMLQDIKSASVIFVVTIINAILGTVQHIKAEKSLESLKALSAPVARVLRDGSKIEIPSREVVVGDILFLEAGDFISADGRILENFSLQVNESSLTGESVSVLKFETKIEEKDVTLGDRKNMVYSGSLVTYGRAVVIVTAIGMETEIGKIASLLQSAKEKKTPLQVNLDKFGKKLAFAIIALCALVFALNVFRGYGVGESFMFAVALAVAAIPEALSSIVTIVLSIGTQKMAKENAIVRKLQAVESLGGVSIICSDKTGTLTKNIMEVKKVFVNSQIVEVDKINIQDSMERSIVEMGILCNDAITENGQSIGDPTEIALVNMGEKYQLDEAELRTTYPRLSEIPFDSDRKLMSTLHYLDGEYTIITKGALDVILGRAKQIVTKNGIKSIKKSDISDIEYINKQLSKDGLRVLAFAYRKIDSQRSLTLSDENELVFAGMVAMMDPPRDESRIAVSECMKAGIKPVMITGDHIITASAIAKQIGILNSENEAMEGFNLDKMTDDSLREMVDKVSVYARVSPEHKIRIVRAWQEKGHVVAMTGDGVNDAPALKQADIGIAMGRVGTEVAKDASSMVLTDDNFATIVKAVSNGRSIYANIKNSIQFLLSGNMAGILAVLYASVAHLPLPFSAVHLLFINLITDSMPAIALGMEPQNKDVMKEKPRNMNEPILSMNFLIEIILEGAVIGAAAMMAFYYGWNKNGVALGSTMAFATLSLARLFHGFNCRSKQPLYKIGLFTNKFQWIALVVGGLLLLGVLTIEPLRNIFKVEDSVIYELHMIPVFAVFPLVVIQGFKSITEILHKK
jgi:Ca2+-transporting ATPase